MNKLLNFDPILDRQDLLPQSIVRFLENENNQDIANQLQIAEIDSQYTDTEKFVDHYDVNLSSVVNTVIVEAVKGENRTLVACVVPSDCKADLNKTVRKSLGVRRVSFAPLYEVLEKTGMEHGSITIIGLPKEWSILVDSRLIKKDLLILGGGLKKSKIQMSVKLLHKLSSVQVIENLGIEQT